MGKGHSLRGKGNPRGWQAKPRPPLSHGRAGPIRCTIPRKLHPYGEMCTQRAAAPLNVYKALSRPVPGQGALTGDHVARPTMKTRRNLEIRGVAEGTLICRVL